MKIAIIYRITNLITGRIYIGQTTMLLRRRWAAHKRGKRYCPLTSSMKKHGKDKFIIEHICSALSPEYLDELEIQFIAAANSVYPNGYNLSTGGRSNRGTKAWNKGQKATPEARLNQSLAHMGQEAWNKGLKTPESVRAKQSAAKVGRRLSPATEFKKGQIGPRTGSKHSAESLLKISQNSKVAVPIICNETGEIFSSIKAAVIKTGIDKTSLQELVITGKVHRRTGLSFRRAKTN